MQTKNIKPRTMTPEQQFFYDQGKLSGQIKGYYEGCRDMRDKLNKT